MRSSPWMTCRRPHSGPAHGPERWDPVGQSRSHQLHQACEEMGTRKARAEEEVSTLVKVSVLSSGASLRPYRLRRGNAIRMRTFGASKEMPWLRISRSPGASSSVHLARVGYASLTLTVRNAAHWVRGHS